MSPHAAARRAWLARMVRMARMAPLARGLPVGLPVGLAAGVPVLAAAPAAAAHALRFPRDHGAHTDTRIEWWYATGWLADAAATPPAAPAWGFQITFFRSRTGLGDTQAGRFAPRQILFAHAAITDVAGARHRHAQQLARWSGDPAAGEARAASHDTDVSIGRWRFAREADGSYRASLPDDSRALALDLTLAPTQPLLLQGDAGWSRKGPQPQQASHYYSQPQLRVRGRVLLDGQPRTLAGTGWLDHEWSDELMPADAVGWDWIGINLADGGALTAFRLRRRDGTAVWAGGSHRPAGGALRVFGPQEVRFEPLRRWRSPGSGADYPVRWRIVTPAGTHLLHALLDAQELDSRGNTGAIYWEGLSELLDASGRPVGHGYLEMTGYAAALKL